jgi:hypothetical protein
MKWRAAMIVVGVLALFAVTPFVLRSGPRPICHVLIDGALQQWMLETGHTNDYPNAAGVGSNSLAMIQPFIGQEIQQYEYVPGLRWDDSKELVLMYMRSQTHYTWHGDAAHAVFSPRRWMVLSPNFPNNGTCPEGGELLDTPEFKRRLETTISFLRNHQRPYWQTSFKEQSDFLKSIKDK